jgi:hypothetical protein
LAESSVLGVKVDDIPPAPSECGSLALLRLMLEGEVKADHDFLPNDLNDHSGAGEVVSLVLAGFRNPSPNCNEFQSNGW